MLEQTNKFKSKMLNSLTHELKTPLNCSINLLTSLLEHGGLKQDLIEDYLKPSLTSNKLLLFIIHDILDLAEIEQD